MKSISGIINVVILTLIILVCIKNSETTAVDLIFTTANMPRFVLLLTTFILGMIFGKTLFSMLTKKKKK